MRGRRQAWSQVARLVPACHTCPLTRVTQTRAQPWPCGVCSEAAEDGTPRTNCLRKRSNRTEVKQSLSLRGNGLDTCRGFLCWRFLWLTRYFVTRKVNVKPYAHAQSSTAQHVGYRPLLLLETR